MFHVLHKKTQVECKFSPLLCEEQFIEYPIHHCTHMNNTIMLSFTVHTSCYASSLTSFSLSFPTSTFHFSLRRSQDRVEVNGVRLKISNLALEDSGMYQCVAENKHGTIYSTAELRVQGRCPMRTENSRNKILHTAC